MRRRDFIALLGGAATTSPRTARAQPSRMRRVGVLMTTAESDPEGQARVAALRAGLEELGWREGRNLRIDWRWSAGDTDRIRAYAAELGATVPDLIVANGTAILAEVRRAAPSVPIVFAILSDPIGQGYVASLARPGGNITGFTFFEFSMIGKMLDLLKQLAPGVTRVAFMFNPQTYPYYDRFLPSFEADARRHSVEVTDAPVRVEAEIEAAVTRLASLWGGGLIVPPDTYTLVHRGVITDAARRHRIPAIYSYRQLAREGGLMAYGPDTADIFRRSAAYVDRILKGASPAELPVQAPTKFNFVINLGIAKELGLDAPPNLIALADEVIE